MVAEPQTWLAGPQACLYGPEGGTNEQTDGWKNWRIISPFYRTTSPIEAAARKEKGSDNDPPEGRTDVLTNRETYTRLTSIHYAVGRILQYGGLK